MILSIAAMILLPLAMALLLAVAPLRPFVVRALGLAPLPALLLLPAAWQGGIGTVTLAGGWTFVIDQPGALMLGASSLLWIIGGFAARRWLLRRDGQARFALWWLLTLSGSLGVFVAGDVVSFYALYALASLPAYGLIAFGGSDQDRSAGRITLAAALLGEGLILVAFVIMAAAAPGQGIAIAPLVQALPLSPLCGLAVALIVAGFGLKIGLVPLHGWMPLSYAAGPLAATAVLSGATSKAGLIGLIRFLPLDTAMPVAGGLLAAAGLLSAFYGAVLGLTQTNPRSVLAYSSVSQLGQMAAVLGAGLSAGAAGAGTAAAFYAVYHVLTKGGLFLFLGAAAGKGVADRLKPVLAAVLALGFAGLPLTGGALGKLAFKDVAGVGAVGLLLSLAAIGSTLLMLQFLRLARQARSDEGLGQRAWVAAGLCALALPWVLFTAATGAPLVDAVKLSALLELGWPILIGAALAWGLAVAGTQAPRLPPGDASAAAIDLISSQAPRLATLAVRFEAGARRWPVSALALSVVLVVIAVLLVPA